MTTAHTHIGIKTSRFHVSQHTITVIHYSPRDDRKQSTINKRIENSAAPAPETFGWFCIASLQGASQGCFSPPLPFQQNKWTGWTACDICMIGGDHLNRLSSQSLNSLRAAKSSSWQSPLKTLAVLIAALEVTTSITKWISNDKQAL